MVEQQQIIEGLDNHQKATTKMIADFAGYLSQLPKNQKANGDKLIEINRRFQEWHQAVDNYIMICSADRRNGFWSDKNFSTRFAIKVQDFLQCRYYFWESCNDIHKKYEIIIPTPDKNGYETIGHFINSFDKKKVEATKKKWNEEEIATGSLDEKIAKPITEQDLRKISIWIGAVSIIVSIGTYFFADSFPEGIKPMLKTLFAFGIGGLSAGIMGYVTVKFTIGPFVSAGGGIAIAILLLYYPPKQFEHDFAVEIAFKKPNHSFIQNDLTPRLKVNGNFVQRNWQPDNYSYRFPNISAQNNNESVGELYLPDTSKWVFSNGRKDTTFKITDKAIDIYLLRDSLKLVAEGRFPVTKAMKIIINDLGNVSMMTDSTGYFRIRMPDTYEGESVTISYQGKKKKQTEKPLVLGYPHVVQLTLD